MLKVAIIDFGAGNLHSAYNAVKAVVLDRGEVEIVSQAVDFSQYSHIIMPGVGAFDQAMKNITAKEGLVASLTDAVLNLKKPFLGICIGMQILVSEGFENKKCLGLGWLSGKVKKFSYDANKQVNKIPHMGWNNISFNKVSDLSALGNEDFYFVHSYYVAEIKDAEVIARCNYINDFPAIIGRDNIIATQFHPEKSGAAGRKFLQFFLK